MTVLKFIFAMILSFLPGAIGVLFAPVSSGTNVWYSALENSTLTPDGWIFSVVWIILYTLLGIALFFIMQKASFANHRDKVNAYTLFGMNAILNALWSYVFFGLNLPEVALIVLTALLIISIFMARSFYTISKASFVLVLPYILWLMFALYLNSVIIYLN